jgi:hypothetical protein
MIVETGARIAGTDGRGIPRLIRHRARCMPGSD